MKITIEIPNATLCAFFDFVYLEEDHTGMMMQSHAIGNAELYDGAEIIMKSVDEEE